MSDLLQGTADLPAVGRVRKAYILVPATVAGAYVAWRWYQSRQAAAETDPTASGLYTSADMSEYGLSTTGGGTTVTGNTGSVVTDGTRPSAIDDNAEWTQAAVERLTNQGYDGATVTSALGEFLARRALDKSEATVVRAALAIAGQPPVGGPYSVIEEAGTDTGTLAAPSNLAVTRTGTDYVSLSWSAVPGASGYAVYRSDTAGMAVRAGDGSVTVYGLRPNTRYAFQVAAVGSTGKEGPKSAPLAVTTGKVNLTAPTGLRASAVTRTSFRVTANKVPGATMYRWYLSGREMGSTDQPYKDFTGLRAGTGYSVAVKADSVEQHPGPASAALRVTTKR